MWAGRASFLCESTYLMSIATFFVSKTEITQGFDEIFSGIDYCMQNRQLLGGSEGRKDMLLREVEVTIVEALVLF